MSDPAIEPSEILIDRDGTIREETVPANPWLRLLGRMFDYSLLFFLIYFLRRFFGGRDPLGSLETLVPYEYFVWIPFEAALLMWIGTTPGKWIVGTKISQGKREKFSFSTALQRSFKVWFRGIGMGIPFINFLCMLVAYQRLKIFKTTSWDRDDHIRVVHRRVERWRIYFAAIVAICGFLFYGHYKEVHKVITGTATHHARVI